MAIKFHVDVAPWWAQRQPPPPPISDRNQEEDNCSEGDSEAEDHSYLPHEVFALTWHADVGNIMHMVPCIAYFIHQICQLLSLDMLCVNAICLLTLCICESCNAILFSQASYM